MHPLNYLFPKSKPMKMRSLFVLLLFVVSAGITVWIYYAATREPKLPKGSPAAVTLSDLDACSHRKHIKSVQYDHFAKIADQEHRPDIAHLFRAMAISERVQEGNCANAIVRLGGHYTPPQKVVVFHAPTLENLNRSILFERESISELHGADIDRALANGNRYAARTLIWAMAADSRHMGLMARSRWSEANPSIRARSYVVCPTCGNTYATDQADRYCPHCMTRDTRFIRVE